MAYAIMVLMSTERHVRLFRNGRNQAVRIPREFELETHDAVMRKEGSKIIIEPVAPLGLIALLASFSPMPDQFPDIDKTLTKLDDIEL